jgi:hypothetical protein
VDERPRKRQSKSKNHELALQATSAAVIEHVKRHSKKYAGMYTLWMTSTARRAFTHRLLSSDLDDDFDPALRYDNDENLFQGQLHDLTTALGAGTLALVDNTNRDFIGTLVSPSHMDCRLELNYSLCVSGSEGNELVAVRFRSPRQEGMRGEDLWTGTAKSRSRSP